jgi:predicted acetyltransferase
MTDQTGQRAPYPMRPITEDEWEAYGSVPQEAFNNTESPEAESERERITFEFDRSLAAFDGSQIVGTACIYTFRMAVPGAVIPTAGVSAVSVLPTYRRRGILSAMMREQLTGLADGGEAVAALFASEPAIYGRFGYGVASMSARFRVRQGEGRITWPGTDGAASGAGAGPVRLRAVGLNPQPAELAKVYDQVAAQRPGMLARDDRWWQAALADPEHWRGGAGPLRCVVAEDGSGPCGYALYSVRPDWDADALPSAALIVRELIADGGPAAATLWADLLSRDLVGETVARLRPIDDPLLYLLPDLRRARTLLTDGLWVRLTDVGAALSQRSYSRGLDTVFEVTDDLLPGNAGRWRLQVEPDGTGAVCERTSAAADLALPVSSLGAAFLGGTRLSSLARAGRVTELRPGTLTVASSALSWDTVPWSPMIF